MRGSVEIIEERDMRRILVSSVLAVSVGVSGCGFHAEPLVAGGVGGGAIGAGTGALIGAAIANGDIAASALLGGAIGIPVGLAVAALYDMHSEKTLKEEKQEIIDANNQEILTRQRELDSMREQLRTEGSGLSVSGASRAYIYDGHTYGNRER